MSETRLIVSQNTRGIFISLFVGYHACLCRWEKQSFGRPRRFIMYCNIQHDLDKITDWCRTWQMQLNINKCVVLRCTRSSYPVLFDYVIDGKVIMYHAAHYYYYYQVYQLGTGRLTQKAKPVLGAYL